MDDFIIFFLNYYFFLNICTKVEGACVTKCHGNRPVPWRAISEQNRLIDRKMATLRFPISRKDYHVVNRYTEMGKSNSFVNY